MTMFACRYRQLQDGGNFTYETTVGYIWQSRPHYVILSDSYTRPHNLRKIERAQMTDIGIA